MPAEPHEDDKTRIVSPITIGLTVSHYTILEKIGAGGMGEVYLAQDTSLNRKVALKFLPVHLLNDESIKTRFKREAQAAASLDHPNIVTVYEVGEFNNRPFFAMQYVDGKSLADFVKERELSLTEILNFAIQICEGLQKAHAAGVVHRDVKPMNIVIDSEQRPRILDFGLASIRGMEQVTKTGSTLGTIRYMSPEQAMGKEVDHRTDLFSLGIVLYELITRKSPFNRDNDPATLQAILSDTPEPLSRYKVDVPEGLQRIIDRALEKDLETRYQNAAGLIADLKREKKLLEGQSGSSFSTAIPESTAKSPGKRWARLLIPSTAILLILLLILTFKPWKLEISSEQNAAASQDLIAVMYFDNLANPSDSSRLAEILTNLLITDLSESQYLKVVSSQKLYDLLKLLGKEGAKSIDREMATRVAQKANARRMLTGSILQVNPRIVITTQVIEVATGQIQSSERVNGEPGEEVFTLVDKLHEKIKKDLALPAKAIEEQGQPVADVTTHSPEAYRYYLEGLDYINKLYYPEARKSLLKAVSFDSTFAAAYSSLSSIARDNDERQLFAQKAYKNIDHCNWKERHKIASQMARVNNDFISAINEMKQLLDRDPRDNQACFWLGLIYYNDLYEPLEAINWFKRAVEIDSLDARQYNELGYAYARAGQTENSIWAINRYIALAPSEPNPYDTRGDFYAWAGNLEKAIESYKKALEIKPDFASIPKLGVIYQFKKQFKEAEKYYRLEELQGEKRRSSTGRFLLAALEAYKGKFENALNLADQGIIADRANSDEDDIVWWHIAKAQIYLERRDYSAALMETEKGLQIARKANLDAYDIVSVLGTKAYVLASKGDTIAATRTLLEASNDLKLADSAAMIPYWASISYVKMAESDYVAAAQYAEKSDRSAPDFSPKLTRGRAYLGLKRYDDAVQQFEKALKSHIEDRAYDIVDNVLVYYYAAQAYEKAGSTKKAIANYEEFLDIWREADPGNSHVEDAKVHLAMLKSKS